MKANNKRYEEKEPKKSPDMPSKQKLDKNDSVKKKNCFSCGNHSHVINSQRTIILPEIAQ